MNCFVIGGTGMVGALVVERLAAGGHEVRVGTRAPARLGDLPGRVVGAAFQLQRASAEDFAGMDCVFCMIPRGVVLSEDEQGSLCAALSTAGVARVVLMTGLGVDRTPDTPLRRLEVALGRTGVALSIVRPTSMFQNLCAGALREGLARRDEIAQPAGDARISFVDARDVADVATTLLVDRRDDAAFDLTGAAAYGYEDLAAALGRALQRPIRYRPLADDGARIELAAAGLSEAAIEARFAFLSLARRGVFSGVTPDVERVLGRPPRTIDDFVTDHVAAWRKEVA